MALSRKQRARKRTRESTSGKQQPMRLKQTFKPECAAERTVGDDTNVPTLRPSIPCVGRLPPRAGAFIRRQAMPRNATDSKEQRGRQAAAVEGSELGGAPMTCGSCGGVIGRDCFNPEECALITQSMANDAIHYQDELQHVSRVAATAMAERDDARQATSRFWLRRTLRTQSRSTRPA